MLVLILHLIVYLLSGLWPLARKPREKTTERRLLLTSKAKKVVFPQDSNLQPSDYPSTTLCFKQSSLWWLFTRLTCWLPLDHIARELKNIETLAPHSSKHHN